MYPTDECKDSTQPHLSSGGQGEGQKSHLLLLPTWRNGTYFQIIKTKQRSEGEGGFSSGWVVFPHGDYFRASDFRLHLHLLHQEKQKAFAPPFTALRLTHLCCVKSLKSDNPHKANSVPIN